MSLNVEVNFLTLKHHDLDAPNIEYFCSEIWGYTYFLSISTLRSKLTGARHPTSKYEMLRLLNIKRSELLSYLPRKYFKSEFVASI